MMKEERRDRRASSRTGQSRTIRIRAAEAKYGEEIRPTLDVSWGGLYFATSIRHYFIGMVVFVTMDFHGPDPMNRESRGTVTRIDNLKPRRWGVAIQLDKDILAKQDPVVYRCE
jgi:hypothetical protein